MANNIQVNADLSQIIWRADDRNLALWNREGRVYLIPLRSKEHTNAAEARVAGPDKERQMLQAWRELSQPNADIWARVELWLNRRSHPPGSAVHDLSTQGERGDPLEPDDVRFFQDNA
ncbi:MAG: hypothetical protein Q9162_000797 [Coniocarpon cinnabarinum]